VAGRNGKDGSELLLAAALAGGATQAQAAERTGVSARTVRRRLADPSFAALVSRLQVQTAEDVLERLSESAVGAVETLVELTKPPAPAPVRLAAAKAILEQHQRYTAVVDVDRRLRTLESADDVIDIRGA
jgi:hypothetical protein